MDIYQRRDIARKELAEEEELRRKGVEECLLKLAGRSIAELGQMKEYWIAEKRRNKYLDDASKKRRLEAIYWIEAIDKTIQTPSVPVKQQSSKTVDLSPAKQYIEAIIKLKMSTPRLDDLERATGISSTTWHRHLGDPATVMALQQEIKKKLNYAKTDEKRMFWNHAKIGVEEVITKIHARIKASRSESFDPVGYPSIPNDIDPELRDIMEEDMGRTNPGNSSIDDND